MLVQPWQELNTRTAVVAAGGGEGICGHLLPLLLLTTPGPRQRLLNTLEANADATRREWRELADARREGAGWRGKGQGGGDGGKGAVS